MTQEIFILNNSAYVRDEDLALWMPAWTVQLNQHMKTYWTDLDYTLLTVLPRGSSEPAAPRLVFEDGVAGKLGDLGYHTLAGGTKVPRATVDAQADAQYGCMASVTGGHELCEMARDPLCQTEVVLRDGRCTLQEVCDAWSLDTDAYGVQVAGQTVMVPNFTLPGYWVEDGPADAQMDFMGKFHQTFPSLPPGGYAAFSDGSIAKGPLGAEHTPEQAAQAHHRASTSQRCRAYLASRQ